ncbi:MAG: hypothetical protein MJ050_08820 [Phascolarctobacterium sp.]|nr:hypothetical protein [Phascolarctobacterium sp.]
MCQPPDWSLGDKYLRENAPELKAIVDKYSPCTRKPKAEEQYFRILLSGIIAQQLPPEVSEQLMKKLDALVGLPVKPEVVINTSDEALCDIGISAQKVGYLKGFAKAIVDGSIDFGKFPEMTDSQITKQLLQVRGLGQWTIEMFLLLALCRTDVCPSADFIFKKQLQKLFKLNEIPKRGQINKLTEHWRPWRSLAVWYLWLNASETNN